MKKHILFLLVYLFLSLLHKAQLTNPISWSFPPTPNPLYSINNYTRASQSISLQCNSSGAFQYGLLGSGANGFLNLSISSSPSFVNSAYLGSSINPNNLICGTTPALDVSKPVAEIPGNFAVSSNGAATYQIPINISPGTNGVQPDISINYSSQSGLGLLGVGFNLNGFSVISRSNKTPMHDGNFGGIHLNTNDAFALDGNRLFSLSGIYGQSNSTYYLETENFSKITSYGSIGVGPEKFEVKDKNGNTIQYGFTSDSRLVGIGNSEILSWYINKFTDEFGNYITYSYSQLAGEIVLDKIEYTGNSFASLAPYNSLSFNYIPLAESNSSFVNGAEFKETQLLKEIICKAGTLISKKYVFEYEWKEGTYLSQVKEVDAGGNELNPTYFCWDNPNDYSGTKTSTQNLNANFMTLDYIDLVTIPADFNADGFSDFACFNTSAGRLRVYENTFSNNYGSTNNNISFNKKFDNSSQVATNEIVLSSTICDENKDGKQEVFSILSPILYNSNGNNYSNQYYILKTNYDNNNNVVNTNLGTYNTNSVFETDAAPSQFLFNVEDYNGDGIIDNLKIDNESISLLTNSNTYTYAIGNTIKTFARPFNFDGDGISEYITSTDFGTYLDIKIIRFSGNSFYTLNFGNITISFPNNGLTQKNLLKHINYGDLNGDGIDDIVYINESNSVMYAMYGTGIGFTNAKQIMSFTPLGINNDFDLSCLDVNTDGKQDVIVNENNSTSHLTNYFSYLSFGDYILKGGSYQGNWKIGNATKIFYEPKMDGLKLSRKKNESNFDFITGMEIHYGDFNGDGIFDYVDFNNGSDQIITNNVNGEPRLAITKIYTPLRNNIELRYTNIGNRLSVNNNVKEEVLKPISSIGYTAGIGHQIVNIYCVSHVLKTSGYSGQFKNSKRYIYSNPTLHQFGRGFLGFEEVTEVDVNTNIGSQTTTSINPNYFIPVTFNNTSLKFTNAQISANIWSYLPDFTNVISKNTQTISIIPRNSFGYVVQLQKTESTDYLNSNRNSNEYTYNMTAQGNIQTNIEKVGWNLTTPIRTSISNYSYILNNGNYKIWKHTFQTTQTGQPAFLRDEELNYDNSGHLISKLSDNNTPGLSNNILNTIYSQFNPFGSHTKILISAPDVSPRTSEIIYDATGRFIIKKINAIGNFNAFDYEPMFGNIIQQRDISGLITKFEYDNLGRLKKVTSPNNTVTKQIYTWESPNNYPYSGSQLGSFSIKSEQDASPYSKVYYTGNGLVLRKETQDFEGKIIISDNEYNTSNSLLPEAILIKSTEPHYLSQTKFLKTTFDYETSYYRPKISRTYSVNSGSSAFTGFYSQTNYNTPSNLTNFNSPYVEIENQSGQKIKKILNSAGQVTLVNNFNLSQQQQTTYSYHSSGQPLSINLSSSSAPNQNILHTFLYNGLGQKIKTTDPSHGSIDYVYNTIGELLQMSGSNGNFIYTYDNLGRIVTKTGSQSGTYSYEYNSSGNGISELSKITGPNCITEYQYDGFNRMIQSKEILSNSNKIFTSNFIFDSYGREIQHTYPSGYMIKNIYNNYGYLTNINNSNNQSLWQLKDMNANGSITEFDYGNGITTKNKYNDLNQLIEIQHGTLHKQNYAYDNTSGMLNWRRFRNFVQNTDLQEFIGVDNNNRLTQTVQFDPVANVFQNANNVSYDIIGNITHKDDAGDYHYSNPSKPFMLTQISNATNNVSLNTLSLTHNDFDKTQQLSEMGTNKQLDFIYGNDEERMSASYNISGNNQYTRYYAENYDLQETANGYKSWTYIFAPSGLCAINYDNNGNKKMLYTLSDHLGSPVILTSTINNNPQAIIDQYSFDAWGRRRNPIDWSYNNISTSPTLIRGFTFHEQIDEFSLVNMNGRIYDPVLGRFIQPDNFVQAPDNLQNYNRYAYVLNNPTSYKDPDGNILVYFLLCTDAGYQFQKNLLPLATHVSMNFGSEKRGIGIDASIGKPQAFGPAYRVHAGVSYNWKNNGVTPGWEVRHGSEWSFGLGYRGMSYSTTHYDAPGSKFDQTTGTIKFFSANGNNLTYENDWQPSFFDNLPLMMKADHGDRHRTAALQINIGLFTAGFNLFTGDPGIKNRISNADPTQHNRKTYEMNSYGNDPNEYRTGAAYLGFGPVKIGWNSEGIRHLIQNRFAHDFMQHGNSPWFKQLEIKPKFYFNFGSSGYGNGLY